MQQPHLAPTLAALLGSSILFACDPEQDFHDDDEMADSFELDDGEFMIEDMPSELDELELEIEAESNEQTTEESSVCTISGPYPGATFILANSQNIGTTEISISVPQTAYYDFNVTLAYPPYLSAFEIQKQAYPYTVVTSESQNVGYPFIGHDDDGFDVTLEAPANAAPGSDYAAKITLYDTSGQCSPTNHFLYMHIADCTSVGWWATGSWPTPGFDNANCYVASLPPGQQSFVWNNSWYVQETAGNQCAIGVFDGANCYIGSAPGGGQTAFIWNNALYFTP
jgi:hypothetical protein